MIDFFVNFCNAYLFTCIWINFASSARHSLRLLYQMYGSVLAIFIRSVVRLMERRKLLEYSRCSICLSNWSRNDLWRSRILSSGSGWMGRKFDVLVKMKWLQSCIQSNKFCLIFFQFCLTEWHFRSSSLDVPEFQEASPGFCKIPTSAVSLRGWGTGIDPTALSFRLYLCKLIPSSLFLWTIRTGRRSY